MFSRRRSRSHYDPQQYNAGGMRQPSASASAAANAYYQRQLGPSAAAEALRRHSLDQTGANAMRDFELNSPSRSAVPRRANSLTTRSYQVVHTTPSRSPSVSGPRPPRTLSYARSPSLTSGPPRRNSLTSDRANSLTRTHTVVNRDASGRTLSLTTTTIRQMGSFELVSTKDVPIASPSRHLRQQHSFDVDFGSRTNSLHSLDSELVRIQEDPEEDAETLRNRLDRLGDPLEEPIVEEESEEEFEEVNRNRRTAATPKPSSSKSSAEASTTAAAVPVPVAITKDESAEATNGYSETTLTQKTPSEKRSSEKTTSKISEDANKASSKPLGAEKSEAANKNSASQSETAETDEEEEKEDSSHKNEDDLDDEGASDISDATPSPASARAPRADLVPPVPSEPLHREVSPVRSALRNGNGSTPKTKVSFGGTEEPYVYESYEYEDDNSVKQTPGAAAASAAARSRQSVPNSGGSLGASTNPMMGASAASAATGASNRRRLVMSQPPLRVEKRASQTSLSGKSQTVAHAGANMPYPHTRPWDLNNDHFVDAPQSIGEIPVPERNAARQRSAPRRSAIEPKGGNAGLPGTNSSLGANGLRKEPDENDDADLNEQQEHDEIRSQAIALAQATFQNQNKAALGETANKPVSSGPSHHYRSLVEDDAASVRSDSSFTRERKSGRESRSSGVSTPGRMRSLRQSAVPTLRNNPPQATKKGGRKLSLLNQNAPNLDMSAYGSDNSNAGSVPTTGFRTFSLRNTQRPDPSTLLAGNPPSPAHKKNDGAGGFRSRIADSDSDDDGIHHHQKTSSGGGSSGRGGKRGNSGKLSLGDMFSPSTDVKDIFKSRATSDSAVVAVAKPKKKNGGFFKRIFGKKEQKEF